jgi:hypothetical protein
VVTSIAALDTKVITSAGENNLEITPLSSFNNGVMIEPVNTTLNKGVSAAFFLRDTSSWSFYTDSKTRLTINGNGEIKTGSPLLINNAEADGNSVLRINGPARFDTSLIIQASSDTNSFISLNRNAKYFGEEDDKVSPYTLTPTAWAVGKHLPVFQLRHPNNVAGSTHPNISIQRDFKILPYEFGTAIEFNGVVECWVGEWSIHKGVYYNDVEGNGNGFGAVLWVGDDMDGGGIRATARNNKPLGGNVQYGELAVEKFGLGNVSNGDFRLRLPSTQNQFQFVYGGRGSNNIVASLSNEGLTLPKIPTVSDATAPAKGQIVFDSTDNQFKGYNGTEWVNLSLSSNKADSYNRSSTGTDLVYAIPHGLGVIPSYFNVIATSETAAGFSYVTANQIYLLVHYTSPPQAGTNNLSWNWHVRR